MVQHGAARQTSNPAAGFGLTCAGPSRAEHQLERIGACFLSWREKLWDIAGAGTAEALPVLLLPMPVPAAAHLCLVLWVSHGGHQALHVGVALQASRAHCIQHHTHNVVLAANALPHPQALNPSGACMHALCARKTQPHQEPRTLLRSERQHRAMLTGVNTAAPVATPAYALLPQVGGNGHKWGPSPDHCCLPHPTSAPQADCPATTTKYTPKRHTFPDILPTPPLPTPLHPPG